GFDMLCLSFALTATTTPSITHAPEGGSRRARRRLTMFRRQSSTRSRSARVMPRRGQPAPPRRSSGCVASVVAAYRKRVVLWMDRELADEDVRRIDRPVALIELEREAIAPRDAEI